MKHTVIYPGTFDPVTNGHVDIITRVAKLFSRVVVAVASNSAKKPYLSLETRIKLIQDAVINLPQVFVFGFDTLLVDFAHQHQANILLRGLRVVSDFEYELQLAGMNRKLSPEIETLFLAPSEHLTCISSSLVREISMLGGDVTQFVPFSVVQALAERRKQGV